MPPENARALTVTVVIPTRNERGNIEDAIRRLPKLGKHTEVIFVDGNSTDGTPEEIERVIEAYPDHDIRFIPQGDGVGKGDAVRKGFAAAEGDVLMILDADLTVSPGIERPDHPGASAIRGPVAVQQRAPGASVRAQPRLIGQLLEVVSELSDVGSERPRRLGAPEILGLRDAIQPLVQLRW